MGVAFSHRKLVKEIVLNYECDLELCNYLIRLVDGCWVI